MAGVVLLYEIDCLPDRDELWLAINGALVATILVRGRAIRGLPVRRYSLVILSLHSRSPPCEVVF